MAIEHNYYGERVFSPDELRMAVSSIRRGVAHEAIFYLQRAFGHDTAMVELIENEWRRK